ncbi:MAG TPA: hypothetical protein VHP35_12965 [Terriglobia bacterium]|jgi:hypothetical protein|nr:hypothetical protein [Terriglobia bacterium]
MNLKMNDVYICTEPCCRAEITVRRGANPECPGKFTLRCCCGKDMVREDLLVPVTPRQTQQTAGSRT